MCNLSGTLPKQCGANPQGVSEIILFNRKDVQSIGVIDADTQTISTGGITLATDKKGYAIEFTEETAEANDGLTGDTDAQQILHQIMMSVAGQKPVMVARLQQMIGGRFLALVRYVNGDVRLYGTLFSPLRLRKGEGKSGKYGSNDMRGYALELSASCGIFPPYYTVPYDTIADRNFI